VEHTFDDNADLNMPKANQKMIVLKNHSQRAVLHILNQTMADETVLCMKTRNAHWNVHGPGFLGLRTFFNNQYLKLIEISEGLSLYTLELGGLPIGCFVDILKLTRLHEHPGIIPGVNELLFDHEATIFLLRDDAILCSETYEDHGTSDILVDILGLHENMAITLRSHTVF
jgi:starvation-inducible DNA-binding protein